MTKGIKTDIIETEDQLRDLVDYLVANHAPPLTCSSILYIDLEGVNLGREGSVTVLTLLIDPGISERHVWLQTFLR
jgi:exonuclease 3'-5' domain-containing protein 1